MVLIATLLFLAASPEKKPDPAEAARLNNLGCAYMNQQLFEKALKNFQDAATLDPNLQVARLNQGIALLSLARVDAAKEILEAATKSDPGNPQRNDPHAWYSLGMLNKNSSDTQAAVDDFRRVVELDDSDPDTWYFLGTVYSQLKQFPQAIDAFDHALKLNPLHASAQFGLARAYQQSGDSAHAREHMVRFQYITQKKLGAAMSLAYGEQGKYSLAEESPAATVKVPPQIPVKFVDVTREAGLITQAEPFKVQAGPFGDLSSAPYRGPGACFLDYDNDGRIDVFLPNNGAQGGMTLYHNLGNGRFEDVTKKAGFDPASHGIGCTAGDYDNDGFEDLAVTSKDHVFLFHNEKNGTFKDVAGVAGIKSDENNIGVTFIDYDHDGDLDLFIARACANAIDETCGWKSNSGQPLVAMGSFGGVPFPFSVSWAGSLLFRNNGNGTFTDVTAETGLKGKGSVFSAIGTDFNNDRAIDIVQSGWARPAEEKSYIGPIIYQNQREGAFTVANPMPTSPRSDAVVALDFDHDGWMDLAYSIHYPPELILWRNKHAKQLEATALPTPTWDRIYGVAAFDYDNDGWVDLVAVGETKEGKGEIKLFRNLGPDGWKDVTADVGLDKIQLKDPRAIITGDYDNDGATDLLITQNHGPAVLLKNEGGNKNNWLRLVLKGLNSNKSAIGTKVEVFSDGIRQKYEIYGSNGYLGQNSPYLTVGLGQAKQADVVRMLWPGGVMQDEIEVAANKQAQFTELDRRGSSCPTLFVWDGKHYELVADVLGAGVVGHWVGPGERNIPRPTEYVKVDPHTVREKDGKLSFRLMEPMEEVVYLDQVKLLAVDHPADEEVYPNEYFASNPPYPEFKVITSAGAKPPAGAWDDKGRDLLPDLLAHKYIGTFDVLPFKGFTKPHSLTLDLGEPYRGGPLKLLMHGEIEYFTATGMYAASQSGIEATAPYVEAEIPDQNLSDKNVRPTRAGKWVRVTDDMGFPAGLPRTITADLTGKLPRGTTRIRITTNLQIYWDSILIDRSQPGDNFKLNQIPLAKADLGYHGYPRQVEDQPPGNVKYVYEEVSLTGPYARQAGEYTRYGDVTPLLTSFDDKLVVFGSGEEVQLEFDPAKLPPLPEGWTRDYFFMANGYEKDMDFYAAEGSTVEPLPFRKMGTYPYPGKTFPSDREHLDYMLQYNTRFVSGNEPRGYAYEYPKPASK